jgi:general secretion pathway protein K
MSLDDPWAAEPVELPMDGGAARVTFADQTACFNINSLAATQEEAAASAATDEFIRLAGHFGIGEFDARALAETIADWVDADTSRRPQGAEDEYYTTLPSPYRAGNAPMASVSELRAVKGVTREVYGALKPSLCALRDSGPSPVNVNMLAERHAPLLAAMLGEKASVQAAEEIIAARPVGGYERPDLFLDTPLVKEFAPADRERYQATSRYVIARAEIVYDTALLEMTSEIAVGGNGAQVISRRIGAEE